MTKPAKRTKLSEATMALIAQIKAGEIPHLDLRGAWMNGKGELVIITTDGHVFRVGGRHGWKSAMRKALNGEMASV